MEFSYTSKGDSLSERDYFLVRLAALTPFTPSEPGAVTAIRRRIDNAEMTCNHLRALGLSARFSSLEYEGLRLRGIE